MLIGDRKIFAIECHHDPLPNPSRGVFGRMCLWFGDVRLGDPNEPACMLTVTEGHLRALLERIDSLHDPALDGLTPIETFQRIHEALFSGSNRSAQQAAADANRFFKFDFLTNGGESFDRTRSFVMARGSDLRFLFRDETDRFHTADIPREVFADVTQAFLEWIRTERAHAG